MISIMIPCFSVDDKLGDWVKCRSLFRNLYELDLGVYLIVIMEIGGLTIVRIAFQVFGDYMDFRRSCGTP